MRFLISPSKTMKYFPQVKEFSIPIFEEEAYSIVSRLSRMSVVSLEKLFKVSTKIAEENKERFQEFGKQFSHAIDAYTGYQYTNIDVKTLNEAQKQYLQEHLIILSGLYGMLRPFDRISLYRLPMETRIGGLTQAKYYRPMIEKELENEELFNLCSKEYSESISEKLNVTQIEFYYEKNSKLKMDSMEAKKMRGQFIRFIAKNGVSSLAEIKLFSENNYVFSNEESTEKRIVFVKKLN